MDAEPGYQSMDNRKNIHEEVAALLKDEKVFQVEKVLDKRIASKGKEDKVCKTVNSIPSSQDGRGDSKAAPSAVYLQKTGDPSKKKQGRPRKSQSIISSEAWKSDSQLNADDPSSRGRRRITKLPSKFNDYIVGNFDDAITSAAFEEEILPGRTSNKANKNVLKIPRAPVIPLGGDSLMKDAEAEQEKLLYLEMSADFSAEEDTPDDDDFPELTLQMEVIVAYNLAIDMGNPDDVISFYDDIPLCRKAFRSLNKQSWLIDDVLNCYLKLLMERSKLKNYPSMYCFSSFFFTSLSRNPTSRAIKKWTRDEDIFECDLVLFILHLYGFHWALCAVDNRDKTITVYDSFYGNSHEDVTVRIKSYLISEMRSKRGIRLRNDEYTCIGVKNLPQQQNSYDCGIFTLLYAECITRNAPLTFKQEDIPYFRRRIAWELINHKLM